LKLIFKGGVLVPKTWDKRLIRVLNEHSPIRQYATNKKSHNPVVITKSLGGATVDLHSIVRNNLFNTQC
jgi:HK97 family phage major capsid protein